MVGVRLPVESLSARSLVDTTVKFTTLLTMTTSLPVYDFSTTPEERAAENAKIDAAIASAEKAMKEAPAVKAVKAKLVKPKATKKATAKAGRIVGISKDENAYIQQVLDMIADDDILGAGNPNFAKIQARYNK